MKGGLARGSRPLQTLLWTTSDGDLSGAGKILAAATAMCRLLTRALNGCARYMAISERQLLDALNRMPLLASMELVLILGVNNDNHFGPGVVQASFGNTTEVLEGVEVAPDERSDIGPAYELDVDRPRPSQHRHERPHPAPASAIDRIVHHSVILEFDVPSYRTNTAQGRQLQTTVTQDPERPE